MAATISLGDLEGVLRLRDELTPVLAVASKGLAVTATAAAATGAAIVGLGAAMIAASRHMLDMADQMSNLSARTGVGVEALQKFQFAGAAVGVSAEQIAVGLQHFQRQLVSGSKESTAALKTLGLTAASLRTMLPEQQLTTLLTTIAKLPEPAQRTAMAMELLGRGGAALVPLGASLEEIMHRAEELGVVMDSKTVAAADALGDSIGELQMTFGGLVNNLGSVITSNAQVHAVVELLTQALAGLSRWVHTNREAISQWVTAGILFGVHAVGTMVTALQLLVLGVGQVATAYFTTAVTIGKAVISIVEGLGKWSLALLKLQGASEQTQAIARIGFQALAQEVRNETAQLAVSQGQFDAAILKTAGTLEDWRTKIDAAADQVAAAKLPIDDATGAVTGLGAAAVSALPPIQRLATTSVPFFQRMAMEIQRAAAEAKELGEAVGPLQTHPLLTSGALTRTLLPGLSPVAQDAEEAKRQLEAMRKEAERIAKVKFDTFLEGLVNFAYLFGDAWGQVGEIIANTASQVREATTGFEKFAAIARGVGQLGGMIGGKAGGALSGAASGALMGASLGSIIPGIGTVAGAVVGGVAGLLGGIFSSGKKQAEELKKKQKEAMDSFASLFEQWKAARAELATKGAEGINSLIGSLFGKDGKFTGEFTSAANAAAYVAAQFQALRASGMSITQALEALGPALEAMGKDAKKFAGTAAGPLIQLVQFAKKNEGLIAFMEGLGATAASLSSFGLLTQDLATKIGTDLSGAIDKMIQGGLSREQALGLSAQSLYDLEQAAKHSGVTLDAHTQKLIDDAKAAGLFEGLQDPMEQLVQASLAMVAAMGTMISLMGGAVPAAIQKMIDEFNSAQITIGTGGSGTGTGTEGGGGAELPPVDKFQGGTHGQLIDFGTRRRIEVHGKESIFNEQQHNALLAALSRPSSFAPIINTNLSEDQVERMVLRIIRSGRGGVRSSIQRAIDGLGG